MEEQGEKVSDTIYNSILLNIPDDYKITVSILESQEQLTPTVIINCLLEETRKIYGTGSGNTKVVLMSNSSPGNSATGGKAKKKDATKINFKCTSCGKNGHVEIDCWIKHPEKHLTGTKSGSKSEKKKDKADVKYAMSAV